MRRHAVWLASLVSLSLASTSCTSPTGPSDACRAATCASLGVECGMVDDGCGTALNCGGCTAPATCGGRGVPHSCGTPEPQCSPAPDRWCLRSPAPTTPQNLNAVWGPSANDIWAVGNQGTITRWDGTAWTPVMSNVMAPPDAGPGVPNLRGVGGSGASDVWAVGDRGVIARWNGTAWAASESGVATTLFGVWAAAPNDAWAVGQAGVILHWDGMRWSPSMSGVTRDLRGVWGAAANDVWAVGASGTVLRWNGMAWTPLPLPPPMGGTTPLREVLTAVHGSGPTNVFVVGERGTLVRWDGMAFAIATIPLGMSADGGPPRTFANTFTSVWTSGANDAWAMGVFGPEQMRSAAARWNGMAWRLVDPATTADLFGVWGFGPRDVWTVGRLSTIGHFEPQ